MHLNKGEAFILAGHTLIAVGNALNDPSTPDKITVEEWTGIVQSAASEALKIYLGQK